MDHFPVPDKSQSEEQQAVEVAFKNCGFMIAAVCRAIVPAIALECPANKIICGQAVNQVTGPGRLILAGK
jgi:hypothetical protein